MGAVWLVPAVLLTASATCALLPKRAAQWSGVIASMAAVVGLILMAYHFRASIEGEIHCSTLLNYRIAGRQAVLSLETNPLSAILGVVVAVIAAVVITYSVGYMRGETGQRRFFAEMSLFAASMLTLVLAADYLLLYVAWEVVGACSYLLIGYHWNEEQARRGALKALLTTRAGDLGLLLGVALIFVSVGGTRYEQVFAAVRTNSISTPALYAIPFLLLAGALGKSAQFPLQLWLPDAMAGPTPVSALLHSATMVAAGIYLIARSFPLFAAVPSALTLLLWLASFTAILAALAAAVQSDVKRLLAYSTISQLGEMGMALGLARPMPGIFHLITQASFKALLFLAAGIVTKEVGSNELSKLRTNSQGARFGFLIGALSLSGIPPLAGFWSKDAISHHAGPGVEVVLAVLSVLSAFYIARAYLLGFIRRGGDSRGARPEILMALGVWLLALATMTEGFIQSPVGAGWLGRYLNEAVTPGLDVSSAIHAALAGVGWLVALSVYRWRAAGSKTLPIRAARLRRILMGGFGTDSESFVLARVGLAFAKACSSLDLRIDQLADRVAPVSLRVANVSSAVDSNIEQLSDASATAALRLARAGLHIDRSLLDDAVENAARRFSALSERVRVLQTGRVYHYLALAFVWVLVLAAITIVMRL